MSRRTTAPVLVVAVLALAAAVPHASAFEAASTSHRLRGAALVSGGEQALSSASHRASGTTIGEGMPIFTSVGETSGVTLRGGVREVVRAPGSALGDEDGDGVVDPADNCPQIANSAQDDRGGVGAGSLPDGTGDACQCGDVTGDGRVTAADAVMLSRALLVPPRATLARPDRCDVGGSAGCTNADVVILRRALLQPPTAKIRPACALAPAS